MREERSRNYRSERVPRPYPHAGEYPAKDVSVEIHGDLEREDESDDL